MQYPLEEKIGNPDLLSGREEEFEEFAKWIANIPRKLSKSRVILARRKSGKTAFVQRLFNQLWSENGAVIPFYFSVPERNMWLADFAVMYYRTFASQYISFLERDETLVRELLTLEEIRAYGQANAIKSFVRDVDLLFKHSSDWPSPGLMWETACDAPHRFAAVYDKRFLVILDEFQYLAVHIYPDEHFQTAPMGSMPGSYHTLSESKVAPMLVTGSYVSWLTEISRQYLEAGRLSRIRMSPYLTLEEGLQAVYKYAEVYQEPITNETAVLLNRLCLSDPFFIACVVQSHYKERDLSTPEGVINTVNYEVTDWDSEMNKTWEEYINLTLPKINDVNSKQILLHLSKHNDRTWTPGELKEELGLEMAKQTIQEKLNLMVEADLIGQGPSDIDYQGLQDGTLYLILRHRFEKEITSFTPDFKQDFRQEVAALQQDKRRLQGMLNNVQGQMAELQLAREFENRRRLALSDYFEGVGDATPLTIEVVQTRFPFQGKDGRNREIDVKADGAEGRQVLVEVKKRAQKMGLKEVEDFWDKVTAYREVYAEAMILPAYLSLGGFTAEALAFCRTHGIGTAERIAWHST